jgi:hypothetical protein
MTTSHRQRAGVAAIALAIFAAALVGTYGSVWKQGVTQVIPVPFPTAPATDRAAAVRLAIQESDALYSVWVIGRNAQTLLFDPAGLFDAQRCFPVQKSLALGESALGLSLLGTPVAALTRDPVATFNFALAVNALLSALAMCWVVTRWTGEGTAGIAAGLLYAFHAVKIGNSIHPYAHDTAWTLLVLYFARQWWESGRWRHALGFAASVAMQLGASLYPILGSALVALVFGAWLLTSRGLGAAARLQLAVVALMICGVAFSVFGPYLELRADTELTRLGGVVTAYGSWNSMLPGGRYFVGWPSALLLLPAVFWQPSETGRGSDPRLALLAGAALVALFANGGNAQAVQDGTAWFEIPNPYLGLAGFVPGLDQVRVVSAMLSMVFCVQVLLAGFGAAAVIRRVRESRQSWTGWGLVAVCGLYTLLPALPGDSAEHLEAYRARPNDAAIAFFERLAEVDSGGPILEVPMARSAVMREGIALLLSAYHQRPTSACTDKSFSPVLSAEIDALGAKLPDSEALARLRDYGFETLIVHRGPKNAQAQAIRDSAVSGSGLEPLLADRDRSAYAIR